MRGALRMDKSASSTQNPMSEYLLNLQLIVTNTEFKDKTEADKYETYESKTIGDMYVRAVTETDTFESHTYSTTVVLHYLVAADVDEARYQYYIENPHLLPRVVKKRLLEDKRKEIISRYVEPNAYYQRLTGHPFQGDAETDADKVFTIPDEFYKLYEFDNVMQRGQPIHELTPRYRELFINSDYYKKLIKENPDVAYLRYLGSYAIPVEVSRPAKDGMILRINTSKLSTYHPVFGNVTVAPNVIHQFVTSYNETHNYVYNTLRGNFSSVYANYDSFIRFLTIYLSIGNALNEFMHKSASMIYMNNVTANEFFMLYGLPSVIMEGSSMIDFLKQFRMLLMDKGTNNVYRVKDLIGYEYTDIYTLVMVKQQVFENGIPIYDIDDETGEKVPKQNIVFRRLGTTDDNTSYFKFRNSTKEYPWQEIMEADPRWWNTPETEQMLYEMNYTLSNSKYIQLSTHLSMTDIWWQCVILLRGLLDNYTETQFTTMSVNFNVNGSAQISVYEAVLVLVILMNFHMNNLQGDLYLSATQYNRPGTCIDRVFNSLYADGSPRALRFGFQFQVSSFNFELKDRTPAKYDRIKMMEYLEPDTFIPMLDAVMDRETTNVGEALVNDVKMIYKYLERKLFETRTIHEFRQVTDAYEMLFLVDPERDWYDNSMFDVDAVLMSEYNLTSAELASLKSIFIESKTDDLVIPYQGQNCPVSLYAVMNNYVYEIKINNTYPFRDNQFVNDFVDAMKDYHSISIENNGKLSSGIKDNYQAIISDKVVLEASNTPTGPKSFDAMLYLYNASLYRYVMNIKNNGESMMLLMRSIVKALESYTNTKLSALEFKVVGKDEYFRILKEVITYFKSYMVEFTKDEFVYIMDGLFDHGGHSNMLRLYDEIAHGELHVHPKDSLALFDVSRAVVTVPAADDNVGLIHDEALVRVKATYQSLQGSGFPIWFDDGKELSQKPYIISPTTEVLAELLPDGASYKIIINVNNIDVLPPNYVGNAR
jgi:hypothetical protein